MYQHGKRTRQPRGRTALIICTAIVSVVLLAAWYMVHQDIGINSVSDTDVPIVTEVGLAEDKNRQKIIEPLFSMELPADWKLVQRKSAPYDNSYIWTATKKGADDRKLTLYIDTMPQTYKLVKMLPLTPNGTTFLPGNVSGDCSNFAGGIKEGSTAPVNAKWENVSFVCDPIKNNQTIGTGTPGGSIGTTLTGSRGNRTFFFYYEDHNIHPDDSILRSAVSSFQAL